LASFGCQKDSRTTEYEGMKYARSRQLVYTLRSRI
jgi:hypothetical protein